MHYQRPSHDRCQWPVLEVLMLPRLFMTLFFACSCAAQTRPLILGISHMAVYISDTAQAEHFYVHDLGLKKGPDVESAAGVRYYVNREQFIEALPVPPNAGVNRLAHIAYLTSNTDEMRRWLGAHGVAAPQTVDRGRDGSIWFHVKDPEGNNVEFTQPPAGLLAIKNTAELYPLDGADPVGQRIIHVGMLVRSRDKEDTFYRQLLGFRPYWYGGMQPGKLDWVSQQVPDGHDWLEYMLTSGRSGSGIPARISQRQLGVLNHFSLGVVNMEQAVTVLAYEARLDNHHVGPQLGRDGKWQYNLFDPDGTRVELMEFSAVEKPCCSQFTALNPTPGGQP
jgi:catechol 2,3-dioxygenase-like lactoylglutathione lyase family enzyme